MVGGQVNPITRIIIDNNNNNNGNNNNRKFVVTIRQFKVAIIHFELQIVSLKKIVILWPLGAAVLGRKATLIIFLKAVKLKF